MAVIGDMLGVLPEERGLFLKWSDDMMEGLSSTVSEADMQVTMDAFMAYNDYTKNKIEQRRAVPTEDLISVLVHAEVDGQRLSDDDILQETLLILVGGDETTRHTISGGTEQLIRHREQWDLLQNNPDLVPLAIEEMLRWTSPLKNMARTITADTDFHGTQLRQGEKMLLMFESANFDETVFGDPDNFNVQRDPNSHLAFGFGTHFCLGNQLARIELINMIGAVLKRLPDLRLADPRRAAAAARELRQRAGSHAGGVHAGQADRGLSSTPAPRAGIAFHADFARDFARGMQFRREGYFIWKFGARFSLNASGPSLASSERNTAMPLRGVGLERVVLVHALGLADRLAGSPARRAGRWR